MEQWRANLQYYDLDSYYNNLLQQYKHLPAILTDYQKHTVFATLKDKDILCLLPTSSGKTIAMVIPVLIIRRKFPEKVSTVF